jgi:hypothetical protein
VGATRRECAMKGGGRSGCRVTPDFLQISIRAKRLWYSYQRYRLLNRCDAVAKKVEEKLQGCERDL